MIAIYFSGNFFRRSRMSNIHVFQWNLIDFSILMFSVLMLFHCSFNKGIEIEEGRGRPLQLISLEFFEDS